MSINFTPERWLKIKEDARLWWAGKLKRPLIQMNITGGDPCRHAPRLTQVSKDVTSYDQTVSAEDMVDFWDYKLSETTFLGDAFPNVWIDFGPGVLAAFLGARVETGAGTVWFYPEKESEIADIRFQYDPDNVWLRRIEDICRASIERWQGLVQVGMTDLGGSLDVLSTFRPSEKLLMDLYDFPDEVKRLNWEAHELWSRYFKRIAAILQPTNPGYTAWTPIFSEVPYYILQCDFSYMISPAMFDEFVKPELAASCKRLANPFYHLDGPGQLPHLDSLLKIKELKGVQWIPGAGKPDWGCWPEVYRKIRDAGKLIQLWGDASILAKLVDQLGSAEGIVLITSADISQQSEAEEFLKKYGALG